MIDLRSDTVTKPSQAMLAAMMQAEVGDDIYGEDPAVQALQNKVAKMLGKEAALFMPSGTMANQICLNVLTEPGDEVICEADAHIFHFESGALAKLSGIQVNRLPGRAGLITADQIAAAVRPGAHYYPRTSVIALENTHNMAGGTVLPLAEIANIAQFAKTNGLKMHLDGARLWNACVASGNSVADYACYFDSVSMCFSKGLGAPIGSIIAGTSEFIAEALRCRKQFGGAMRQVGYLAAAADFAIENNFPRLKDDHAKARAFAEIISESPAISLNMENVVTNIIMFHLTGELDAGKIATQLQGKGILLHAMGPRSIRVVTHLNVTQEQVVAAAEIIVNLFQV